MSQRPLNFIAVQNKSYDNMQNKRDLEKERKGKPENSGNPTSTYSTLASQDMSGIWLSGILETL